MTAWLNSIRIRNFLMAVLVVLLGCSSPILAETSVGSRFLIQGPAEQNSAPVIRDALGRPCLSVEAAARSHVVNADLVDHIVSIKNSCSRLIKIKLCYYGSDRCREVNLLAYKREDVILGTMTKVRQFRYTISQK